MVDEPFEVLDEAVVTPKTANGIYKVLIGIESQVITDEEGEFKFKLVPVEALQEYVDDKRLPSSAIKHCYTYWKSSGGNTSLSQLTLAGFPNRNGGIIYVVKRKNSKRMRTYLKEIGQNE